MSLDVHRIRRDFPILQQKVYGKTLVYLDNGATTQKPQVVIDKIVEMYTKYNANIHRGVHYLSEKSTQFYEESRQKIARFIGAAESREIIFTKGTTDSVNIIANAFASSILKKGDHVLVTALEHHANLVPWQMVCEKTGAELKIIPINEKGEIIQEAFREMLTEKCKILSLTHVSNSLGTIVPIKEMISLAHQYNIPVLVDAAQSVQHMPINVQELDCDFLAFSGHKVYGPTGIGVLYGKATWLEKLPPYQGGGDMIDDVEYEKSTYTQIPLKFEAGTNNYVDAIALGEALNYIESIGLSRIEEHEKELLRYATEKMTQIEGLKIIGTAANKTSAISFTMENVHNLDAGMILDKMGIAVRTGHHCAQPLMKKLGITGTIRISFAMYNTKEEIDTFIAALQKLKQMFN